MKLKPLVIHAGLILPRYTSLFSDPLTVSSVSVVAGGTTTFTAPGHGLPVGAQMAISLTDAKVPNPITAAVANADGTVTITTQFAHDLTTTPDADLYDPWHTTCELTGFTSALANGVRQLVAVPTRYTVTYEPGGTIAAGPITLNGNERLMERFERELVGWHAVTAASASTLTLPTPAIVSRSYTVANPTVVKNVRIWGVLDYETALAQYTADDADTTLTKPVMFLLPMPVKARRMGGSQTGASYDKSAGSDFRLTLDDGFTVLVLIPSQTTAGHADAIDLAQGDIFRAVLRTFNGLRLQRAELSAATPFQAVFESHTGGRTSSRAIYAHEYLFDMPAELHSEDSIAPNLWAVIDDGALDAGTVPTTIYTDGTTVLHDLDITGILHHGHPSPLTGSYSMDG